MRLLITIEDHLFREADGYIYGQGTVNYTVWAKYLEFFDEVALLARTRDNRGAHSSCQRVDGPSVFVHGLPDYAGPRRYAWNLPTLKARVRQAVSSCDAYLFRVPGLVGPLAWREIRKLGKPFAAELLGDPWDSLGPGSIKAFLRPIYRYLLTRDTKSICEQAAAVLYVSREALQRRYPAGKRAYTAISPDVNLCQGYASPLLMTERFRRIEECCQSPNARPLHIGFIGSLAQMYKGPDTFLQALSLCLQGGLKFNAFLVGEGRYRRTMEELAAELGISEHVAFLGQLGFGKQIADFLDSVDLFVMPSRAEGFGRALVEAMSRGCPAIGSSVGGITELLAPKDRVPSGDANALAAKILEVMGNSKRLKQMSQRNLERAKRFDPVTLFEKRRAFLRHIRSHSKTLAETRLKLVSSAP
jgi:glycosyltransferase involved in cell wall biosynthesis